MTTLSAELLAPLNNDNGICDAARVSFSKAASQFTDEENAKLLGYLHKHGHWSPYGHARELFALELTLHEWLFFLENANLAGFTWSLKEQPSSEEKRPVVNGSLWAWYQNLKHMPKDVQGVVKYRLLRQYPVAGPLLFPEAVGRTPIDACPYRSGVTHISEHGRRTEYVQLDLEDVPNLGNILYVSFRIRAPIFVARQLVKHQVGLCWNEESRRYIESEPEFHDPEFWRPRPDKGIKQGSKVEAMALGGSEAVYLYNVAQTTAVSAYNMLLHEGVAPEQARMVLPLNSVTEWIWTGSLKAFARVMHERLAPNAQYETREIAKQMNGLLLSMPGPLWREVCDAL